MRDERKWRLAVVEFHALRANIPGMIPEAFVNDYHAVLDRMAEASEEDLDTFRVPAINLKPRVVSFRMGSYRGGPGGKQYSKDNFCESNLFQRKIGGLAAYLPIVEESMQRPQVGDDSRDYWLMSTAQLERLANKFRIDGYADQRGYPDRDIIINALLRRDRAMRPQTPAASHFTNVGTIIGSNVQQNAHGATAKVDYSVQEQRELLRRVREVIPELDLTGEQTENINADLTVAELQLNLSSPRRTILDECWSSIRSILETAAGGVAAAGILQELAQHLHW